MQAEQAQNPSRGDVGIIIEAAGGSVVFLHGCRNVAAVVVTVQYHSYDGIIGGPAAWQHSGGIMAAVRSNSRDNSAIAAGAS